MALGITITLIELLGGSCKIDESDVFLMCQHLGMIGIVHGVVISSHLVASGRTIGRQDAERIAQIVATIAANLSITAKITTTNRRADDGDSVLGQHFIHNLAEVLLVGGGGDAASQINSSGSCCVTDALIISLQLVTIHTSVLFIIMSKGNNDIVAGLHVVLGILPQFTITCVGVTSALGIVDGRPAIGQEVTKIHTPATSNGGRLIIRCHRGVTQRMHLLGANNYCAKHQQQRQHSKQFCFHFAVSFY